MKKFQYDSLEKKFLNIAGVPHIQSGATKTLMERAHLVTVDDDHDSEAMRDWCETHFGNDWIFRWN